MSDEPQDGSAFKSGVSGAGLLSTLGKGATAASPTAVVAEDVASYVGAAGNAAEAARAIGAFIGGSRTRNPTPVRTMRDHFVSLFAGYEELASSRARMA